MPLQRFPASRRADDTESIWILDAHAGRTIHQLAHAVKNTAVNTVVVLDIAHSLVVNFARPVHANCASRRQPHKKVTLRRRIEDTGVENDNQRHGQ